VAASAFALTAWASDFSGTCSVQRAPEQLSPLPPLRGQQGMWLRWQCIAGVTAVPAIASVQIQIADSTSASDL